MKIFIIIATCIVLSACSTQLSEYNNNHPEFLLEEYFDGDLIAYGMVQDYSSRLTRHFCVDIRSTWTDKQGQLQGVINETFHFNDGEVDKRMWRINRKKDQQGIYYTGTAGDVSGTAIGRSEGNVFQWQYDLQIPLTNKKGEKTLYTFSVDDWIYLLDNNHALNKSTIEKFGVTVGHITLFFDKNSPQSKCVRKSGYINHLVSEKIVLDRVKQLPGLTISL